MHKNCQLVRGVSEQMLGVISDTTRRMMFLKILIVPTGVLLFVQGCPSRGFPTASGIYLEGRC